MSVFKLVKPLTVLICLSPLLFLGVWLAPATVAAQSDPAPVGAPALAAIDAYVEADSSVCP